MVNTFNEEMAKDLAPEQYILSKYPITDAEYNELTKKFGKLCYYIAHDLKKNNVKNNYSDDIEDIVQDLFISLMKSGSYHKRQLFIETQLDAAKKYLKKAGDPVLFSAIKKLNKLWNNRKKHGASRQKFGSYHEVILENIIKTLPPSHRPAYQGLKINAYFTRYCKSIIWNTQKATGKKITRERSFRVGQVSLSNNKHLT